jgi:hypothetical protein
MPGRTKPYPFRVGDDITVVARIKRLDTDLPNGGMHMVRLIQSVFKFCQFIMRLYQRYTFGGHIFAMLAADQLR